MRIQLSLSLHSYLLPAGLREAQPSRYYIYSLVQQEAQLSQRGRAMLRVIEYFAKSLKVSQGHSK